MDEPVRLIKMKIKEDAIIGSTQDFFYDLFGGYIEPEDYLVPSDAAKVRRAMEIIEEFQDLLDQHELMEYN